MQPIHYTALYTPPLLLAHQPIITDRRRPGSNFLFSLGPDFPCRRKTVCRSGGTTHPDLKNQAHVRAPYKPPHARKLAHLSFCQVPVFHRLRDADAIRTQRGRVGRGRRRAGPRRVHRRVHHLQDLAQKPLLLQGAEDAGRRGAGISGVRRCARPVREATVAPLAVSTGECSARARPTTRRAVRWRAATSRRAWSSTTTTATSCRCSTATWRAWRTPVPMRPRRRRRIPPICRCRRKSRTSTHSWRGGERRRWPSADRGPDNSAPPERQAGRKPLRPHLHPHATLPAPDAPSHACGLRALCLFGTAEAAGCRRLRRGETARRGGPRVGCHGENLGWGGDRVVKRLA